MEKVKINDGKKERRNRSKLNLRGKKTKKDKKKEG